MKVFTLLILTNVSSILSLTGKSEAFIITKRQHHWLKKVVNEFKQDIMFYDKNSDQNQCETNSRKNICANQDCNGKNEQCISKYSKFYCDCIENYMRNSKGCCEKISSITSPITSNSISNTTPTKFQSRTTTVPPVRSITVSTTTTTLKTISTTTDIPKIISTSRATLSPPIISAPYVSIPTILPPLRNSTSITTEPDDSDIDGSGFGSGSLHKTDGLAPGDSDSDY